MLDFNEARDDGMTMASAGQYMQITCTSLQTDNHASISSLNVYMLYAFPDAQPKHQRQPDQLNKSKVAAVIVVADLRT